MAAFSCPEMFKAASASGGQCHPRRPALYTVNHTTGTRDSAGHLGRGLCVHIVSRKLRLAVESVFRTCRQ